MVLTIKKRVIARPSLKWVNKYEFDFATAPAGDARLVALQSVAAAFMRFERAIHLNMVEIEGAVWSTYHPEVAGSTPENHYSVPPPEDNAGDRPVTPSYNASPLGCVLWVSKEVLAGNMGRLFYRGVLDDSMRAGGLNEKTTLAWESATTLNLIDEFADAREAEIRPYLEPITVAAEGVRLVMFYTTTEGTIISRAVADLFINGATDNKFNHKYFDTSPVTP